MKKIILTLGLTLAAMALSFNGMSQTASATDNKAETVEVTKKTETDGKKACCKKSDSKKACTSSKKSCASKCSSAKTSGVAGTKEAKAVSTKSCTKSKKACCKSKMKAATEEKAEVKEIPVKAD